jgi:exopolysaccharide biosynthesis polyprenyl glycosylphosphotransferase
VSRLAETGRDRFVNPPRPLAANVGDGSSDGAGGPDSAGRAAARSSDPNATWFMSPDDPVAVSSATTQSVATHSGPVEPVHAATAGPATAGSAIPAPATSASGTFGRAIDTVVASALADALLQTARLSDVDELPHRRVGGDVGATAKPTARVSWFAPAMADKTPAGKDPASKDPAGKDPAGKDPADKDPAGKDPSLGPTEDLAASSLRAQLPATDSPMARSMAGSDAARIGRVAARVRPGGSLPGEADSGAVQPSESAASDRSASERAASDRAASARVASERASSDRAASERAASETAANDRAAKERPATEPADQRRAAGGRAEQRRTDLSDNLSGYRWQRWRVANGNDQTVQFDRAAGLFGLSTAGGGTTSPPAPSFDDAPTLTLRSVLGASATVDAILATLDQPAVEPQAPDAESLDAPPDPKPGAAPSRPSPTTDTGDIALGAADRRARLARHAAANRARGSWEIEYVRTLVVLDVIAGIIGGVVAFAARFGDELTAWTRTYVFVTAVLPVLTLASLALNRAYERRFLFVGTDEYQRVLRAGAFMTALTAIISYMFAANLARGYVVLALPIATLLCLIFRFGLRRRLHRRRARGECLRRVIVVGHELAVVGIARQLGREPYHGLEVVGCCLPPHHDGDVGMPIFGTFDDVAGAVRYSGADTVLVLSCPELDGHLLRRLAWRLERDDIDLIVASSLMDVAGSRATVRPVDGLPMLHVDHPRLFGAGRVAKSIFDRVSATVGLIVLAPIMIMLAVAIRLDSPGPAIFRQVRVGRGGREFVIFKFRTMVVDAERRRYELAGHNVGDGVLFKMHADPRITKLGRWMRRLSIDELPQLINVVRGEMSLVGPRPPLAEEVAAYPADMRRRLVVSPGLTGLWQVSGRSDLSWEDTVRLDLRYVENWSFSLDLVILLRTLSAVFRSSGAY